MLTHPLPYLIVAPYIPTPFISPNLPLFPTSGGLTPSKESIVSTLEHAVALSGAVTHDDAGYRLFGGHSFRVTGSRILARLGIDIVIIMALARWSSDVVQRYISEAPLALLADACVRGASASSGASGSRPALPDVPPPLPT